jgi:hypothetical protein
VVFEDKTESTQTAGSESKETVLKEDSKDELIVWMKTFFKQVCVDSVLSSKTTVISEHCKN